MSWSYHLTNILNPVLFFTPVHSSYMCRLEIFTMMLSCCIWMYYLMEQIYATSRHSSTGRHYHLPSPARRYILPITCPVTQLWKPSRTINILVPLCTVLSEPVIYPCSYCRPNDSMDMHIWTNNLSACSLGLVWQLWFYSLFYPDNIGAVSLYLLVCLLLEGV